MRPLALVIACWLCACTPLRSGAPPHEPRAALTKSSGAHHLDVEAIAQRVVLVRGLAPKEAIDVRYLDEDGFDHRIIQYEEKLRQQVPALKSLPAAAPDTAGIYAAFYDSFEKVVWMRRNPSAWVQEHMDARGLVAHELVHALQDQHFGFEPVMAAESMDEFRAARALYEGDAEIVRVLFEAHLDELPLRRALSAHLREVQSSAPGESASLVAPEIARLSPIQRLDTLFPYEWGAYLVGHVALSGGFAAVNRMYAAPPRHTAACYHPETYLDGRQAHPVAAGPIPPGFRESQPSTALGELGLRRMLETLSVPPERIEPLASSWRGDRFFLLAGSWGKKAVVWTVVTESQLAATEIAQALAPAGAVAVSGSAVAWTTAPRDAGKLLASHLEKVSPLAPKAAPPLGALRLSDLPAPLEESFRWGVALHDGRVTVEGLGLTAPVPGGLVAEPSQDGLLFVMKGEGGAIVVGITSERPTARTLRAFEAGALRGMDSQGAPRDLSRRSVRTSLGRATQVRATFTTTGANLQLTMVPICKQEALLSVVALSFGTRAGDRAERVLSDMAIVEPGASPFCRAVARLRKTDLPGPSLLAGAKSKS